MFFYYIVGTILLLLCVLLAGFLMKKKHYREVDRLEEWKLGIMDRPVLNEMSKVKQLNMTGQTEKLFERWRREWDEIVTVHLPDVEEYFIDAEEYIDKYRFKKAKIAQEKIAQKLNEVEDLIKDILTELHDLVGSEEKNRLEIDQLKDRYREARQSLLARGHSFGKSAQKVEQLIDEVTYLFALFEDKTIHGDYLEAREIVLQIDDSLGAIQQKMNVIPQYMIECTTTIPSLMKELTDGYKEMIRTGYILTHIQMEKEVERLNEELKTYLSFIENTEIDEVEKGLEDLKESIEVLFDLLEKEVHAKHLLLQNKDDTDVKMKEAREKNHELKVETELVQRSYQLSDTDVIVYEKIDKKLNQLLKRFELLLIKIEQEDTAQTELFKELTEVKETLDAIIEEQNYFFEKLAALREDEISAREKVAEMSKEVKEAVRLISRSNLPGLPLQYEYSLQDAKSSIRDVTDKLEEKPLNMNHVQKNLEIASLTIEKLTNETDEMVEDVLFAETVIQYGNRYRSRYPSVSEKLDEAEIAFRSFQYKEALEQAATAIEDVEPGALKRVEELINEQSAKEF